MSEIAKPISEHAQMSEMSKHFWANWKCFISN